MRENPNKDVHPSQLAYAGDNFVRYTGEVTHVNQLQLFCWEASEKGLGVHLQAAPSETEKKYKQFTEKKDVITTEINKSILEKYGGAEYLVAPPKEILYGASGESEAYVEYSKSGDVIKGIEKAIPRSKYTEDGKSSAKREKEKARDREREREKECCGTGHSLTCCSYIFFVSFHIVDSVH